jgi:hypothetical protein
MGIESPTRSVRKALVIGAAVVLCIAVAGVAISLPTAAEAAQSSPLIKCGDIYLKPDPTPLDPSSIPDPNMRAQYEAGKIKYRQPHCYSTFQHDPRSQKQSPSSASSNTTVIGPYTSPNWAGNEAVDGTYTDAEMNWTVPSIYAQYNAYSSIWPGVGHGTGSADQLLQAGTAQQYPCDGNGWCYYWWMQVYPMSSSGFDMGPVYPGDTFFAHVIYSATQNTALFHVIDGTQGWNQSWYVCAAGYYNPCTLGANKCLCATAPFIIERPGVSTSGVCYFYGLADYGFVEITYAKAANSSGWHAVGAEDHNWYAMRDISGTLLAEPGPIGSDNMSWGNYWFNYGASQPCG